MADERRLQALAAVQPAPHCYELFSRVRRRDAARVRDSRRTPILSSSPPIAWLSAEVDTPSRFAARVKLRSSATVRKAERTPSSSRTILEWYSQSLVDLTG